MCVSIAVAMALPHMKPLHLSPALMPGSSLVPNSGVSSTLLQNELSRPRFDHAVSLVNHSHHSSFFFFFVSYQTQNSYLKRYLRLNNLTRLASSSVTYFLRPGAS